MLIVEIFITFIKVFKSKLHLSYLSITSSGYYLGHYDDDLYCLSSNLFHLSWEITYE